MILDDCEATLSSGGDDEDDGAPSLADVLDEKLALMLTQVPRMKIIVASREKINCRSGCRGHRVADRTTTTVLPPVIGTGVRMMTD